MLFKYYVFEWVYVMFRFLVKMGEQKIEDNESPREGHKFTYLSCVVFLSSSETNIYALLEGYKSDKIP